MSLVLQNIEDLFGFYEYLIKEFSLILDKPTLILLNCYKFLGKVISELWGS